jgi:hypothetical protein
VNQDVKATEQKKQITQSATESSAPNPFAKYKENNNTNSSSNSSSNKQTIPRKLVTISKDDDILDIDLNKCSDVSFNHEFHFPFPHRLPNIPLIII